RDHRTGTSSSSPLAASRNSRERSPPPVAGGIATEPADQLAGLDGGDAVAILAAERVIERQRPLLVRGEPIVTQRRLGPGRDLARERGRLGQRATGRDEAVGQPHAERLLAGDAAPRQDQVEGVAVAEEADQADRPAVHERDSPAPAEDAEDAE